MSINPQIKNMPLIEMTVQFWYSFTTNLFNLAFFKNIKSQAQFNKVWLLCMYIYFKKSLISDLLSLPGWSHM